MSTADIRDMKNSQSTFWTVALPVTTGVVSLAILAAYKGDSLCEWLFERRERRQTKERMASENRPKSYHGSGDDVEKTRVGGKKRARFSNSSDGNDGREDIVCDILGCTHYLGQDEAAMSVDLLPGKSMISSSPRPFFRKFTSTRLNKP
jgi:hypothetical protein